MNPSPNMPQLDTALVYPGMCLIEGTELSEGRFVLGVGSTTKAWNENWHGITYDKR